IRSSPMTSSDQPTAASGEGQERPEGVIFLGESQWVLGNPPPPGGPLTTVLAGEVPNFQAMTKAEITAFCASTCGVSLDGAMTKAELVATATGLLQQSPPQEAEAQGAEPQGDVPPEGTTPADQAPDADLAPGVAAQAGRAGRVLMSSGM
ncbi:MAG: hypothetical protein ACKOPS_13090, partial [Cyanobium sp.]